MFTSVTYSDKFKLGTHRLMFTDETQIPVAGCINRQTTRIYATSTAIYLAVDGTTAFICAAQMMAAMLNISVR